MGLDTVEILMDTEDTFGIRIPDEHASRMLTVGDLFAFIMHQLRQRHGERCASAATFYRLRRAMMNRMGSDRRQVRPGAASSSLIPQFRRRYYWQCLEDELSEELPPLERPSWLTLLIGVLSFIAATATVVAVAVFVWTPVFAWAPVPVAQALLVIVLIVLIVVLWAAYDLAGRMATVPLAVVIPTHCRDIRGLVYALIRRNPASFDTEQGINETEAWRMLQRLIAEILDIPPDQVRKDSRWIEDLRCD